MFIEYLVLFLICITEYGCGIRGAERSEQITNPFVSASQVPARQNVASFGGTERILEPGERSGISEYAHHGCYPRYKSYSLEILWVDSNVLSRKMCSMHKSLYAGYMRRFLYILKLRFKEVTVAYATYQAYTTCGKCRVDCKFTSSTAEFISAHKELFKTACSKIKNLRTWPILDGLIQCSVNSEVRWSAPEILKRSSNSEVRAYYENVRNINNYKQNLEVMSQLIKIRIIILMTDTDVTLDENFGCGNVSVKDLQKILTEKDTHFIVITLNSQKWKQFKEKMKLERLHIAETNDYENNTDLIGILLGKIDEAVCSMNPLLLQPRFELHDCNSHGIPYGFPQVNFVIAGAERVLKKYSVDNSVNNLSLLLFVERLWMQVASKFGLFFMYPVLRIAVYDHLKENCKSICNKYDILGGFKKGKLELSYEDLQYVMSSRKENDGILKTLLEKHPQLFSREGLRDHDKDYEPAVSFKGLYDCLPTFMDFGDQSLTLFFYFTDRPPPIYLPLGFPIIDNSTCREDRTILDRFSRIARRDGIVLVVLTLKPFEELWRDALITHRIPGEVSVFPNETESSDSNKTTPTSVDNYEKSNNNKKRANPNFNQYESDLTMNRKTNISPSTSVLDGHFSGLYKALNNVFCTVFVSDIFHEVLKRKIVGFDYASHGFQLGKFLRDEEIRVLQHLLRRESALETRVDNVLLGEAKNNLFLDELVRSIREKERLHQYYLDKCTCPEHRIKCCPYKKNTGS